MRITVLPRAGLRRLVLFGCVSCVALALALFQAGTAAACGGLVAPNGAIRLSRATTLVAWHDGVERYMTSFTYQGEVSNLGWIVPLPAVPTKIEEGGAWTLQRLFRETHPIAVDDGVRFAAAGAPQASGAVVLQQVQVEALNITVLRGSGQEVLDWCQQNGFDVNGDTRAHLLAYAAGSPIFMAAKYDTAAAKARGQLQGDGAPVLITMPTPRPWVPFEVLALDDQQVQADLYMLTDQAVTINDVSATIGESSVGKEIPDAPGFRVAFQEPMNATLYHDLSTDRNMGWVRPDGWLTYLSLDAPYNKVTYDLSLTSRDVITIMPFGHALLNTDGLSHSGGNLPRLPMGTPEIALATLVLLLAAGGLVWILRGSQRPQV
jgi:hypothetical protein